MKIKYLTSVVLLMFTISLSFAVSNDVYLGNSVYGASDYKRKLSADSYTLEYYSTKSNGVVTASETDVKSGINDDADVSVAFNDNELSISYPGDRKGSTVIYNDFKNITGDKGYIINTNIKTIDQAKGVDDGEGKINFYIHIPKLCIFDFKNKSHEESCVFYLKDVYIAQAHNKGNDWYLYSPSMVKYNRATTHILRRPYSCVDTNFIYYKFGDSEDFFIKDDSFGVAKNYFMFIDKGTLDSRCDQSKLPVDKLCTPDDGLCSEKD